MKIAFEADVLKRLLVDAGIDSNDAKAIVYDLMLLSQGGDNPRKPVNVGVKTVDPQPAPQQPTSDRTVINRTTVAPEVDYTQPAPQQPVQQPVQQQQQPERSRVRTHKRLSFESFGGTSTPLKE